MTAGSGGGVRTAGGPYPNGNGQLTQYLILDVADFDRATEIASHLPQTRDPGFAVEVRPTADGVSVDPPLPPSEPAS